jgi:hypothetical protein
MTIVIIVGRGMMVSKAGSENLAGRPADAGIVMV